MLSYYGTLVLLKGFAITSQKLTSKSVKIHLGEKFKMMGRAEGTLIIPCLPSLVDFHLTQLEQLIRLLGYDIKGKTFRHLKEAIREKMAEGHKRSPNGQLIIKYGPDSSTGFARDLKLNIALRFNDKNESYTAWGRMRTPPFFGANPDQFILHLSQKLHRKSRILDLGAGTGRNTIPLAELGHECSAVEMNHDFCQAIATEAKQKNLSINLVQSDFFSPLSLPTNHFDLIIASEFLTDFRDLEQVSLFLKRSRELLRDNGQVVFNLFVWKSRLSLTQDIRQMAQAMWSFVLLQKELEKLIRQHQFKLIQQTPVVPYEKKHLGKKNWPPTPWYPTWATGKDLFYFTSEQMMRLDWFVLETEHFK